MIKIKEIPLLERPIERLIINGPEKLSNEELLAILLKTGTKKISSKDLANKLLSELKDIKNLREVSFKKLTSIEGIGKVKAAILLSSVELSKRIDEQKELYFEKITSPKIVFDYYKNILKNKKQEYFYCLYLDSSKKIVGDKLLFIGTINYSLVHPREVFKEAYQNGAISIICVHNHPSGSIFPSKMDIEITKQLVETGKILGIKIDDHIIIGANKYYSFLENHDI